jgi:hypothetical protein
MEMPIRTLTLLYETRQTLDLERRIADTDDHVWSIVGANSEGGFKQLQQRIATLEALANGTAPTAGNADGSGAIEL